MFLAAECFKDTLIEIGLDEESAETARKAFLTLKKNTMEETQNKISKIASKISFKSASAKSISSKDFANSGQDEGENRLTIY